VSLLKTGHILPEELMSKPLLLASGYDSPTESYRLLPGNLTPILPPNKIIAAAIPSIKE
jgi:hypothetical protein